MGRDIEFYQMSFLPSSQEGHKRSGSPTRPYLHPLPRPSALPSVKRQGLFLYFESGMALWLGLTNRKRQSHRSLEACVHCLSTLDPASTMWTSLGQPAGGWEPHHHRQPSQQPACLSLTMATLTSPSQLTCQLTVDAGASPVGISQARPKAVCCPTAWWAMTHGCYLKPLCSGPDIVQQEKTVRCLLSDPCNTDGGSCGVLAVMDECAHGMAPSPSSNLLSCQNLGRWDQALCQNWLPETSWNLRLLYVTSFFFFF